MADQGTCVKLGLVIGGVILGIIILLISISFADVNYYEFGLLRRKSTGQVYDDYVYTSGRYIVGPDAEFKTFKASAHTETLNRITVFASDKLEVTITATFQYFLRKEDLTLLHRQYDLYYAPILRTNAQDALKGAATRFSTRDFIRKRLDVENALYRAIRDRLGGRCCRPGCSQTNTCLRNCIQRDRCQKSDKGLFADVKFFQLGRVAIPQDVEGRFLRALLLTEKTETEQFLQDAKIVQKKTDAKLNDIRNAAAEIAQNATAHSALVVTRAEAAATATIENARSTGYRSLFDKLGLSQQSHKNSFDYLRTLKDQENVHLSVDFGQLMMAPGLGKP